MHNEGIGLCSGSVWQNGLDANNSGIGRGMVGMVGQGETLSQYKHYGGSYALESNLGTNGERITGASRGNGVASTDTASQSTKQVSLLHNLTNPYCRQGSCWEDGGSSNTGIEGGMRLGRFPSEVI